MDRNAAPYYVEPSPAASLAATRELIAHIRALPPPHGATEPLVRPVLTPRFAISCTGALLAELGALAAADAALPVQTHVSENTAEVALTRTLFPPAALPPAAAAALRERGRDAATYADVYDAFGLLRENTILAHGVHLDPDEVALIAARGAGVSHCPTSNFNLRSGCARVGMLLDHGIKVRTPLPFAPPLVLRRGHRR